MAGCADYQMATGITFPLLTIGGAVAQQYGVDRQYLVIDGDGIVRWIGPTHSLPVAQIQDTIEAYLAALDGDESLPPPAPSDFGIQTAYPNPFNSAVRIELSLPGVNESRLRVFDVLGRQTAELPITSSVAGRQTVLWSPEEIAAGHYLLILEQGSRRQAYPVIYLK